MPKRSWFNRRLDVSALRVAIGADVREFALLWLVFSALDVFVVGQLTPQWFIGNYAFGFVLWVLGAYIEMSKQGRNRNG
ncbi:MAG TPA: hypothetical protein VI391_06370 [Thermoanaerobaculia bacterium]